MQVIVETCRKTVRNSGANYASLSPRDLQLARLVTEGRLNKEISFALGITEGTVKVYMSNLYAKLGVSNRAELAAWAVRHEGQIGQEGVVPLSRPSQMAESAHWQLGPVRFYS
jgi:DNA-binding NarL/FixJ family response regulator